MSLSTDTSKDAASAAAKTNVDQTKSMQVEGHPHSQSPQQRPFDLEQQAESEKHMTSIPRLVHRGLPYFQSKNKVNVYHNKGINIFRLVRYDWFHVLLRTPAFISIPILLTIWTIMLLIFAAIYVWYDNKDPGVTCGLGPPGEPIQFGPAFAFSLETCTTGE
jgi:hypothetical protein